MTEPNKPRGRKSKTFSDEDTAIILKEIKDNRRSSTISTYLTIIHFVDELGYAELSYEKVLEGRGRKAKVFNLTPKGEQFLNDHPA